MSQQQLWLSLASVIVPTVAVLVAALINHRATARANDALTQRIDRVEDRVGGVRDVLTTRTDVIGRELSVVLRDVAFLRGRQAERDAARGIHDDDLRERPRKH